MTEEKKSNRVYIKPEDINKLPKGLRIYRGPRGGLYYLEEERRMLEEREEGIITERRRVREEGEKEEKRVSYFTEDDLKRLEKYYDNYSFHQKIMRMSRRLMDNIPELGAFAYYLFEERNAKTLIGKLAIMKGIVNKYGYKDLIEDLKKICSEFGIDYDKLEISERCFLRKMDENTRAIVETAKSMSYFETTLFNDLKLYANACTYEDYIVEGNKLAIRIMEAFNIRWGAYKYAYAKMKGINIEPFLEVLPKSVREDIEREGERAYSMLNDVMTVEVGDDDVQRASELFRQTKMNKIDYESLFKGVFDPWLSFLIGRSGHFSIEDRVMVEYLIACKLIDRMMAAGIVFSHKAMIGLARGCNFMRLWTGGNFENYAGHIEERIKKMRGNGRPVRDKKDIDLRLFGYVRDNDLRLWKEFCKNVVNQKRVKRLYRGISDYELLTLFKNIIEKGEIVVEATSTLASTSTEEIVAKRFGDKTAVVAIDDIDYDRVWGTKMNAEPFFEDEEEIIYELNKGEKLKVLLLGRPVNEFLKLVKGNELVDFSELAHKVVYHNSIWNKVLELIDKYKKGEYYSKLSPDMKKKIDEDIEEFIRRRVEYEQ